ncbi:MAG: hypothetical protein ACXADA_05465 [Candidatus Hodarchaeales archaeon]|jgi:hypothetical protein
MQEKESKQRTLYSIGNTPLPGEDDHFQPRRREILTFTGSLVDKTRKTRHIADLHNKITAQETGYQQKRRYLELGGILSQWFETSLLDSVFDVLIKTGDRKESSDEEEIKKILAYYDVFLRFNQGSTIRWKTLEDMSDYFGFKITKKGLYKYRYEIQKILSDQHGKKAFLEKMFASPVLLMKRLVVDFISQDKDLNDNQKIVVKACCYQIITTMKKLRFIPRDYEIYAYAVYMLIKKELTGYSSCKYDFPVDDRKFRRAISNAIYKIKTNVIKEVWVNSHQLKHVYRS